MYENIVSIITVTKNDTKAITFQDLQRSDHYANCNSLFHYYKYLSPISSLHVFE